MSVVVPDGVVRTWTKEVSDFDPASIHSEKTRDFPTIHGCRPACNSSRLTSSLRNKKAPGLRRGLVLKQQGAAYRLTWRLVPPPGAPLPGSPLETNLTQSELLPLKYEVSLAWRSASKLA